MFPEYRTLISHLKTVHPRFHSLFEKHNTLDHEIIRLESQGGSSLSDKISQLKKRNCGLKTSFTAS